MAEITIRLIFVQLREKLLEDAGKDAALQRIAEFIAWLLEVNNHDDIATKIVDAKKGAPSLKGAFDFAKAEAKKHAVGGCACIEDKDVYWSVVKYLKLENCTSPDEVESYRVETVHASKLEEKLQAPAKNSPFSDDIDRLFDD